MVATLRLRTEMVTKIRGWKGLRTDTALAEEMGIDAGNLSRVLRGKQQPGPKFIASLCQALDAELGDLFEVVDDGKDVGMRTRQDAINAAGDLAAVQFLARQAMTPREQAEAAVTPTCRLSVDELEDLIREERGLPRIHDAKSA